MFGSRAPVAITGYFTHTCKVNAASRYSLWWVGVHNPTRTTSRYDSILLKKTSVESDRHITCIDMPCMQSLLHTSKAYSPSDGLMDPMRCCHQVRRSTPLHYDIYSRFLSLTEGFTNCVTSWCPGRGMLRSNNYSNCF